jgi:DNA polymerase sigma
MEQSILEEIKSHSLAIFKDAQIRLYGSRFKNTAKVNSDIDILIITEDTSYQKQLQLIHALKESEIPYEVDIQVVSEQQIVQNPKLKTIYIHSQAL